MIRGGNAMIRGGNAMKRVVVGAVALCLIVGAFLTGTLSYYDQLEVGRAIVVHDGQVFTPESWDAAMSSSDYAVVDIHGQWKWPWANKTTQVIDGITFMGDPKLGSLKFYGALHFGDGTFTMPDTTHLSGDVSGQRGR